MPRRDAKKPAPPTPGPKSWFGIPSYLGAVKKRKEALDEAAGDPPKKKK